MVTNHFPVSLITHTLSCDVCVCVCVWFPDGLYFAGQKVWYLRPGLMALQCIFLFVGSLLLESAFIASVGCCAVRVMEAEQRLIQGSAVSEALPGRGWSLARPWQRSVLVSSRSLSRPAFSNEFRHAFQIAMFSEKSHPFSWRGCELWGV